MTLHFEWFGFDDAARMALAHGLRKEVFVDEQGFSLEADRDEQDKNALHVLGLDETGAARCTARVFADAPGVWHAGRIAVQRGLRGQGVGRLLLAAVADKARAQGARTLELGAQYDKQGFYEAVGFAPYGEPYLDEGIPRSYAYGAVKQNGRRWLPAAGKGAGEEACAPPPGALRTAPWMV
ncbi:MAG: GNAT family N-acetyltransferase [Ruthenibacterium lactatiformans]